MKKLKRALDFVNRYIINRLSRKTLAFGQGSYFLLGGLWPLFSVGTFMAITGPKTEVWLVKTTGLLLAVIGLVLIFSALRMQVGSEIFLLAICSAASLAAIELFYVTVGRISAIYFADAFLELLFIVLWVYVFLIEKRKRETEKASFAGSDS